MLCFSWHGPGGYDRFIRVDEKEMQAIVNHYHNPDAVAWGWGDGNHYYLVNDEKRVITPLKMAALAFGGQWDGYPPYGGKTSSHFSLDTLPEYHLDIDWKAPK